VTIPSLTVLEAVEVEEHDREARRRHVLDARARDPE